MSYCRWSSDNWRCDLYCYEDVSGGWTTHVASNRRVGEIPELPDFTTMPLEEWIAAYKKQMESLENTILEPLTLLYSGESFNDPTLEDFLARLLELRAAGLSFPDYVLDTVRAEIADGEVK